jgi:hypothetical protein
MADNPTRTPFTRSRWPEYFDGLALDPAAHRRMAARVMERDSPETHPPDWARRFDVSPAGWALADVYAAGGISGRYVVYPINLSINGVGIAHIANLEVGTRVCIHFDRLVEGPISLIGEVRRSRAIEGFSAHFVGIAWVAESRQALIDHLGPRASDAALKNVPHPQSPEEALADAAYRSVYAENRLGNWAATVAGD